MFLNKHLVWIGLAVAACAAPNSSPSWVLKRAETLYAKGEFESGLRFTDHRIARGNYSPTQELVAIHTRLLREVGRNVEADAYQEFSTRYFAGERTEWIGEELSRQECGKRQAGLNLIRSWASPKKGFFEIGEIVATFEIDAQGTISAINIRSARDPASAWGAIDSISRARVSRLRLSEYNARSPERFPIRLCIWRDFDPIGDSIPRDGTIRGGS